MLTDIATLIPTTDLATCIEVVRRDAAAINAAAQGLEAPEATAARKAVKAVYNRLQYLRKEEDRLSQYWREVELKAAAADLDAAASFLAAAREVEA